MRAVGQQRLAAFVIAILGLVLVAAGSAEIATARTASRVADLVRPEMTGEGLAQHRADFETARGVVQGFSDEALPAAATAAGIPPELILLQIGLEYPAVAKVIADQDETIPFAENALLNLERQQSRFERADSLPASWLPGWAGGAWMVAFGAIVAGAGLAIARGPHAWRRPAMIVAATAAVLLIAIPLALQVPGKAADAGDVLDSINPSDAVVVRTETMMADTRAGMTELEERLLPDLAAALGVTPEELDVQLATQFPDVAAGLEAMPAVLDRYDERVAIRSGGAEDLRMLKDLPLRWLGWFAPAFGLVLGAVTAWAWVAAARRPALSQDPALTG